MSLKKNRVVDNLIFILVYWGVSHLNWLIFSRIGILPMPIWPAAGVAFVGAYYNCYKIAPGIAVGSFLANYLSLGAPLEFALLISVMNTMGPLAGAGLARMFLTLELKLKTFRDVFILFFSALLVMPVLTATGGIGFKKVLGLLAENQFCSEWLKWGVAHSMGTLLTGVPLFAWVKFIMRKN